VLLNARTGGWSALDWKAVLLNYEMMVITFSLSLYSIVCNMLYHMHISTQNVRHLLAY